MLKPLGMILEIVGACCVVKWEKKKAYFDSLNDVNSASAGHFTCQYLKYILKEGKERNCWIYCQTELIYACSSQLLKVYRRLIKLLLYVRL